MDERHDSSTCQWDCFHCKREREHTANAVHRALDSQQQAYALQGVQRGGVAMGLPPSTDWVTAEEHAAVKARLEASRTVSGALLAERDALTAKLAKASTPWRISKIGDMACGAKIVCGGCKAAYEWEWCAQYDRPDGPLDVAHWKETAQSAGLSAYAVVAICEPCRLVWMGVHADYRDGYDANSNKRANDLADKCGDLEKELAVERAWSRRLEREMERLRGAK